MGDSLSRQNEVSKHYPMLHAIVAMAKENLMSFTLSRIIPI